MTDRDPPEVPEDSPAKPRDDAASDAASDAEAARLLEVGLSDTGSAGRTPPPTPAEMQEHFPELEILEVLGQGGMGVVYKARQRKLDRLVALKVLPQQLAGDPAFAERFRREARTLARLQHLHIVGVYEFGEVDGFYYLLMEYVDGVTLRQLMSTGDLNAREALAIVPQICDALQYAHDKGVVHRDIKPENVLLDRAGRVKVADFGLAKMMQPGQADFTLTGTDQVMGTLHYMAPEQYKTPQDVDHRADIFSLGVVFFEMLTGELPVGRFANPSEAPGLDGRIDEIVMRALERERELRYQHADDVKADIHTFIADGPVQAPALGDASGEPAGPHVPGHGHSGRRNDRRRMSRWALGSFWMIIFGGVASVLVLLIVLNMTDPDKYPGHRSSISALWTMFGAAAAVVVLATMGIITTRVHRDRVRGLGLSVTSLVIGCVGLSSSLAAIGVEVRHHKSQVRAREKYDLRPQLPHIPYVHVEGISDREVSNEITAGIKKTWAKYLSLVAVRDLRLTDLGAEQLYDHGELAALRAMDAEEFASKRAANELGMGFVGSTSVHTPPSYFRLKRIRLDEWGRHATVTVRVVTPVLRGKAYVNPSMTFPMKRSDDGWVFVIDAVETE